MSRSSLPVLGGRYERAEILAQGGLSTVYKAWDNETGQEVVIKLSRTTDETSNARMLRETQLLRNLGTHPGIVNLLDAGLWEGQVYIVSEFVQGVSLDQWWEGRSVPEILAMLAAVADALAWLHARNVVHRDVKPQNVLVEPDGQPRLLDFGLAVNFEEVDRLTSTRTTVVGTFSYMSPEALVGEQVFGAADVYALGTMTVEALAGLPAALESGFEGLRLRLEGVDSQVVEQLRSREGIPKRLTSLVVRMVARQPSQRPSAAEVSAELLATLWGRPLIVNYSSGR